MNDKIFTIAFSTILGLFVGLIIAPNKHHIKAKTILTPTIELTTDGKQIDTLYHYTELRNIKTKK